MDAAGISSLRRLAETTSLSPSAVARLVHGDTLPNAETVTALASVLRVPESTIYKLTHGKDITTREWAPPAEVQRLSKREQDALTEMIRAMAASREREDVTGNDNPAPITQAGDDQPAHEDELAQRREPTEEDFLHMAADQAPENDPRAARERRWSGLGEASQEPEPS